MLFHQRFLNHKNCYAPCVKGGYTMEYRILRQKDKEAVRRIYEKSFPDLKNLEISWDNRSKENSYGIWNGSNGSLVGFAIASYHRRSGGSLYIDYLALDDSLRGQGIGTEILRNFLGCIEGSVHLFPKNSELAGWYKRNGFKESNGGYYVFHTYSLRNK